MTSITFGGGPTVDARRDFSNLKEGSQVPGYHKNIYFVSETTGFRGRKSEVETYFIESFPPATKSRLLQSFRIYWWLFENFEKLFSRYLGYIHQFKYNNGHTYGDQTHLLAHRFPGFNRAKSEVHLSQSAAPYIRNALPKSNGGNRLTEKMIPGYTGTFVAL